MSCCDETTARLSQPRIASFDPQSAPSSRLCSGCRPSEAQVAASSLLLQPASCAAAYELPRAVISRITAQRRAGLYPRPAAPRCRRWSAGAVDYGRLARRRHQASQCGRGFRRFAVTGRLPLLRSSPHLRAQAHQTVKAWKARPSDLASATPISRDNSICSACVRTPTKVKFATLGVNLLEALRQDRSMWLCRNALTLLQRPAAAC